MLSPAVIPSLPCSERERHRCTTTSSQTGTASTIWQCLITANADKEAVVAARERFLLSVYGASAGVTSLDSLRYYEVRQITFKFILLHSKFCRVLYITDLWRLCFKCLTLYPRRVIFHDIGISRFSKFTDFNFMESTFFKILCVQLFGIDH